MGRVASAHSAKRLSFLLIQLSTLWIKDNLVHMYNTSETAMLDQLSTSASKWGVYEVLPVMVKVFQDTDAVHFAVSHRC